MLFKFEIVLWTLRSFCNNCENLVIPCLTQSSAMFGFTDTQQENCVIKNNFLLIFKFNI